MMRSNTKRTWVAAGAVLALLGCGRRGDLYEAALGPLPLLTGRDALVQVVPQTRTAVVLRPDGTLRTSRLERGVRAAVMHPDGERAVVLAGDAKHPVLQLVPTADGEVQSWPLPAAYDALHLSADGRTAVLRYTTGAEVDGPLVKNLNELGVVDLASGAVAQVRLETESSAPSGLVFGPAEANRQYVAVLLSRGVAVFDARKPLASVRRVPIQAQDDLTERSVAEALFSPDGSVLFLRASGLDDVVAVELGEDASGELTASLNFLAGASGLSDLALPGLPGFERAVVAVYSKAEMAMLLDASGVQDAVPPLGLGAPLAQVQALGEGQFLFFAPGNRRVVAWELPSGRRDAVALEQPFGDLAFSAESTHAVFRSADGTVLSVVSVESTEDSLRARVRPLRLTVPATALRAAPTQRRVFVGTGLSPALASVGLDSLDVASVELDAAVTQVLPLSGGEAVAAVHSGEQGDLTWLPTAGLDRTRAIRVTNFALAGELSRAFPTE